MSRPVRPEPSFPGPAFFVGVLPPPELSARILAWQRALDHLITAPHVTLKAPGGLNAQQTLACREVCRRTPPFDLRLGGVQTFGGRVIYLAASGEGLSALHTALVAAVPVPRVDQDRAPLPIRGSLSDAPPPPPGCTFRNRCPHAMPRCTTDTPALLPVAPDRRAACHLHGATT